MKRVKHPTSELFLGERIVPAALAVYLVLVAALSSTPDIWGIIPVVPAFCIVAALKAMSAITVHPAVRLMSGVAFVFVELGLSFTFLVIGSALDIPQASVWLAAAIHGNFGLLSFAVHYLTDQARRTADRGG